MSQRQNGTLIARLRTLYMAQKSKLCRDSLTRCTGLSRPYSPSGGSSLTTAVMLIYTNPDGWLLSTSKATSMR